ncbi:MAG TPA: fumarylacetoacetate hydrolase family protein [Burkholderiales bacterium]|nr:fumarylacetoacetate hydrolase family protein [Burkholderiales bacterium]
MRLATFTLRGEGSHARVGLVIDGRMLDVNEALRMERDDAANTFSTMRELLERGANAMQSVRRLHDRVLADRLHFALTLHHLSDVRWLPPIPDADKFLCVGKNYRSHLEELKRTDLIKEMPGEPTGFVKLNSCLTGHDGDVVRPRTVTHLDYEPELVFVIGKPAYEATQDNAFDYVAGITLLNDLTCRDTQKREVASGSRFWTAKNAPGFGPLGPCIITMDEVGDPYDIWVTCSVNGQQRMRVNTSEQIWKLPRIIEHFSRLLPLRPGDMFSTGAPGGVAVGKPDAEALFLKPGDIVECAFERPEMVLRNRIVAPAR